MSIQLNDYACSAPDRDWLIGELRSDHAGETGAVWIYRGILAVSHDELVRAFSKRHLDTELTHLEAMEALLPRKEQSRLIPLWKLAGFLTGCIPALFGRRLVFVTINAVESFVEQHYLEQVLRLRQEGADSLADLLEQCMTDEVEHKLEAEHLMGEHNVPLDNVLRWMIGTGSALAVAAARRI